MKGLQFFDMLPEDGTDLEADISVVQLLKAGKYRHYGEELDISTDVLRLMKRNFDNNVKKVDLAIDYFHASYAEAAGWIKDVILKEGDTELWIKVEWTREAEKKIRDKEVRYLSADFDPIYEDNETGEEFRYVLNGGGLTNRPFVKGMNAILSEISEVDISKEKREAINRILTDNPIEEVKPMEFSELKKELVTLSEDQKREVVKACGVDPVKLSEENKQLSEKLEAEKTKNKELSETIEKQEKEAEFAVLLSEGKAVEAQREPFMSGNMSEFVKLSVPVNLSEKGTGTGAPAKTEKPKTAEEAEAKIIELAEAKMKENVKLSEIEATDIVLSENPDLKKLIG